MIRSLLTNEILYPDPEIPEGVTQWRVCNSYYKNAYWDFSAFLEGGNLLNYRRLRMAIAQYVKWREEVQDITEMEILEWWLNQNQLALHSSPILTLNHHNDSKPFKELLIRKVRRVKNIDNTFHHGDSMEERYSGSGWSCDVIIHTLPGTFNINFTKIALSSIGIYAVDTIYDGGVGERFYRLPCFILDRDYDLSDPITKPWSSLYQDCDEEDEDEEAISDAEERAQWFEDGLLDDEIEGLEDESY